MLRSAASKVMWVGRATVFLVGLSVILAVVMGVATMAFAANGDAWRLGRNNVATAITSLGGAAGVDGPMLRITNNNADTNDTALNLQVQSGEPPMTVNSSAKVTNLNSDQLDGKDSTELGQMWAVVRQNSTTDCTLLRGSGATGTTSNAADGFCTVEFSRNLTNCAFIAGLGEPGGYPGADVAGEV